MKIVFLGTPRFASIVLEKLAENNYKPVLVITGIDKPKGRGLSSGVSEAKLTAQKLGIEVLQPEKIKQAEKRIKELNPDVIISAAYGQIIPKSILDIPKLGSINIHPSLLPKYRGPSPIQAAILNGDIETGVTIYFMDEKMDHGPIISSKKISVEKISFDELYDKLANLGAELLLELLPNELKSTPQNESEATYTKIINKEDGKIHWNNEASQIERQIRAYNPWPGSFTVWQGKTLKILEAEVSNSNNNYKAGEVYLECNKLAIKAGQNSLILLKLQIEGKNPVSPNEFLNGHKEIIGQILC